MTQQVRSYTKNADGFQIPWGGNSALPNTVLISESLAGAGYCLGFFFFLIRKNVPFNYILSQHLSCGC